MKRTFLYSVMLMLLAQPMALAQFQQQQQQYGSGIWPGQQGCQTEQGPAPGAFDQSDEVNAVQGRLAMQKKKKVELERKLSRYKTDMNKAKAAINKRLLPNITSQVFSHMDNPDLTPTSYSCSAAATGTEGGATATIPARAQGEIQTLTGPGDPSGSGTPGGDRTPPTIDIRGTSFCDPKTGFNYWSKYGLAGGQVFDGICDVKTWSKPNGDSFDCKMGLQDYIEAKREMEDTREELNGVKGEVKLLERELSETRTRLAELKELDQTEGGYCATCHSGRRQGYQPSGWQVAGGLLTAAAGGALGYFGGKYAVDQNAKLGWPTSPYYAAGLAYPMIAAGIYGAVGGGMIGAVGCGSTVGGPGMMAGGNPGAFGSAPGLYGGMGGMGGMGGYPGMMMMGGGMAMGMPMMGGMGGYPGMMMMGGGIMVGGMPMMGGMGGYPGMMPMMGGMGGYPGMMMMGGGIMVGGMPMMGGYPGMMMMGGGTMMPGVLPYPMMGGGMGMQMMGGMGMQNMMQQQYYSQMQQQMAYQQQAMSDYMQRMQTVGYLSNEMSRLQQQIMMISSGMGGSYSVMPGMGGYGASVLPYPGSYMGGTSAPATIPYPGTYSYPTGTATPIR